LFLPQLWHTRAVRTRALILAGLAGLVAAPVAIAQGQTTVEIAPFIGYRSGGSVGDTFSAASYGIDGARSEGVAVSVRVAPTTSVAFLFSRQDTGVDVAAYPSTQHYALTIDHWMAGAIGEFPGYAGGVHPFMEAYLGATQIQSRNGYSSSSTYFSAALGGGVGFDLTKHMGLRLDARAYAIFVNSSTAALCGGGCTFAFAGQAMFQGEVAAALVLKL
jgi:hypothetical protein